MGGEKVFSRVDSGGGQRGSYFSSACVVWEGRVVGWPRSHSLTLSPSLSAISGGSFSFHLLSAPRHAPHRSAPQPTTTCPPEDGPLHAVSSRYVCLAPLLPRTSCSVLIVSYLQHVADLKFGTRERGGTEMNFWASLSIWIGQNLFVQHSIFSASPPFFIHFFQTSILCIRQRRENSLFSIINSKQNKERVTIFQFVKYIWKVLKL